MLLEIIGIIGAISLFLYGMRVISDSLQKLSGKRMRAAIHKLTNTRSRGFFSGFFLTSLIQTSSASTLLIVSLVNAGVITITASLPMIIGANVGTTVKLWFISYLGFQLDIGNYSLVLIALGFPFLFIKSGNWKNLGEFFIGLALLFLGLYYMKSILPEPNEHSFLYAWIQNASQSGFVGVLMFVLVGFVVTAIIQSSSAAITLTFVLCFNGIITFPLAVAMVLGQNIGTTITVNIGALVGGVSAKRAALSHFLMNFFTVILVLPFFNIFTQISESIILNVFGANMNDPHDIPVGIAFVHTVFNLLLSAIMLPSIHFIIRLTEKIITSKDDDQKRLRLLEDNFISTSELSLLHAKTSIMRFAFQVKKMLNQLPILLIEKKDKKYQRIFEEIKNAEEAADARNSEIAEYLSKISQKEISRDSSRLIIKMLEISDNIETLSDLAFQFAQTIELKNKSKAWFHGQMFEQINEALHLINESADIMIENLSGDFNHIDIDLAMEKHSHMLDYISEMKKNIANERLLSDVPPESKVYFNQMLIYLERMSDVIFNVSRSIVKSGNGNGIH